MEHHQRNSGLCPQLGSIVCDSVNSERQANTANPRTELPHSSHAEPFDGGSEDIEKVQVMLNLSLPQPHVQYRFGFDEPRLEPSKVGQVRRVWKLVLAVLGGGDRVKNNRELENGVWSKSFREVTWAPEED